MLEKKTLKTSSKNTYSYVDGTHEDDDGGDFLLSLDFLNAAT
jgi:hypothetical protein